MIKKSILLVEDDYITAKLETKVLQSFGYEVITAGSGEKAVSIATGDNNIDLILMDIDLGMGMNGPEAAAEILRVKTVPIVFLTSHAEQEMVEKVRGITRYGYVIKNSGNFVLQSSIEMAFALYEAYEREQLARVVLDRLNNISKTTDTIHNILLVIKQHTDFEAVAIRLREGDDFPYYRTNGFPASFVLEENYLCQRDEMGKIVSDTMGNPTLECMCGNILCGRTDSKYPFFTEGGSFWTNSTSDLLASTMEAARQARTRNRCNGEGYESVALIPLRSAKEIIGK